MNGPETFHEHPHGSEPDDKPFKPKLVETAPASPLLEDPSAETGAESLGGGYGAKLPSRSPSLPGREWDLDERTKAIGRRGIALAREELKHASAKIEDRNKGVVIPPPRPETASPEEQQAS